MILSHKRSLLDRLPIFLACLCLACVLNAGAAPAGVSSSVVAGQDGWLFLDSELHFLQCPVFWGEGAVKASRSSKPEFADPSPAIIDFHRQLASRGIALIVAPVPPKSWISSRAPSGAFAGRESDSLGKFYEVLKQAGVNVVDLRPVFAKQEGAGEWMYCKTDSHWSGAGCVAAAQRIAEAAKPFLPGVAASGFSTAWAEVSVHGDLAELLQPAARKEESVKVRQVSDAAGAALRADPASPLLLMGDSHTLVFHDFLCEKAGLADQLALETGVVPDWIGTRGSGANAVRVTLLRRTVKDPAYLGSKKVVVWCFAAREFTEADQGWQQIPLSLVAPKK